MRVQFKLITPMHVQNRIFISELFEMEVSDGGGDLELRGFHGNMSISKHSADLETTRFPWKPRDFQKNMLPLEPV